MRSGGGGGDAVDVASAPTVPRQSPASLELCVSPPEISPHLMQRLAVTKSRSFSDCSHYPILFPMFFLAVLVSQLAIAVEDDVRKRIVALASTKPVCVKRLTEQPSETTSLQQELPKESL